MSGYIHGIVQRFLDWLVMFRENPTRSSFCPKTTGGWGDPNQLFRHGWDLPEGKAFSSPCRRSARSIGLPAQQHVEECSTTDPFASRSTNTPPLRGRRHGPNRREPHRSGLGLADLDCPPRSRHLGVRYNRVVEDIPPTIELIDVEHHRPGHSGGRRSKSAASPPRDSP